MAGGGDACDPDHGGDAPVITFLVNARLVWKPCVVLGRTALLASCEGWVGTRACAGIDPSCRLAHRRAAALARVPISQRRLSAFVADDRNHLTSNAAGLSRPSASADARQAGPRTLGPGARYAQIHRRPPCPPRLSGARRADDRDDERRADLPRLRSAPDRVRAGLYPGRRRQRRRLRARSRLSRDRPSPVRPADRRQHPSGAAGPRHGRGRAGEPSWRGPGRFPVRRRLFRVSGHVWGAGPAQCAPP